MNRKGNKLTVSSDFPLIVTGKGEVSIKCPKCGERKPLAAFGIRVMHDKSLRNQPWCEACR